MQQKPGDEKSKSRHQGLSCSLSFLSMAQNPNASRKHSNCFLQIVGTSGDDRDKFSDHGQRQGTNQNLDFWTLTHLIECHRKHIFVRRRIVELHREHIRQCVVVLDDTVDGDEQAMDQVVGALHISDDTSRNFTI